MLTHTGWNKSRAVAILGIERSMLDRKISPLFAGRRAGPGVIEAILRGLRFFSRPNWRLPPGVAAAPPFCDQSPSGAIGVRPRIAGQFRGRGGPQWPAIPLHSPRRRLS